MVGHLAGVLDHAHSGGVQSDVQSVQDVDHELPHGLKLMRPNTAGAVNQEDQVHRTGLTLLVGTWKDMRSLHNQCFRPHLYICRIFNDLYVQIKSEVTGKILLLLLLLLVVCRNISVNNKVQLKPLYTEKTWKIEKLHKYTVK